ncbi:MAG: acetate--CoA ligase family protein [Polyangia bacterium]|jgi:acetyltransferase|nr:acetate--CoA ligase family protein [Polyangia bacterium]
MLQSLLEPKRIAVFGASQSPGKVGHAVVANLIGGGFGGEIVPVNPEAGEVLGLRCYKDVREAGGTIDLAVIAVPTPAAHDCVVAAVSAGAKAVVVISAGFKEAGPEGAKEEARIAAYCKERDVFLLGPNCLGVINPHHHMNASFAAQMPSPGGISVISQSGALCTAILDWSVGRHLGLAKLISIGNKAGIDEVALLEALAEDPMTQVIIGYLESISEGDEFVKAAETAAQKKPVVILKAGVTSAGIKAASSHTGSLAGANIAYGAAFRRSGVIRAESYEALLDYATALVMAPLPAGDRVAIVTNAGGCGVLAADAVELAGMQVATLASGIATALRAKLPGASSVGNPIDVLGDADPERYVAALEAAQEDPEVDAVIVILTPQAMTKAFETAEAIGGCVRGDKPILVSFMGGQKVMPGREVLVKAGLPDYPSPERAADALRAMCNYAAWRRRPPRVVTRFLVNRRRVERIIGRQLRTRRYQVGEMKTKEVLRAYNFSVPLGFLATTAEEAVEVAQRIGLPVALKVCSPDIVHKSDLGGVRLNLGNRDAVRDAFDLMMLRIRQRAPEARLDGIYVERMGFRGREVILGMTRDPQFGPMLMFGLGGIFVEVMKDVTFHLAPITSEEAMQMLLGTRSYGLLVGSRGQTGVDLSAIASGLQRISQLVTDFPQIQELDINPFIVGEVGRDPYVADARMTLNESCPMKGARLR